MASSLTKTWALNALAAGNQPAQKIDDDLDQLFTASNTLNYYANFYVDTGAANALAITINTPQTLNLSGGALAQGTFLDVDALFTNTSSAVTLTVTYNGVSLGAKAVTHSDWTVLFPGEIRTGGIYRFLFDGTRFQLMNPFPIDEIFYGQIVANVNVTSSNSAAPDILINGSLYVYDGLTKVVVEAFAPYVVPPTGAGPMFFVLADGGTPIGNMGAFYAISTGTVMPATVKRVFTPATGGHTYALYGYVSPGATTGTVACTTGAAAALMPAYLRITRA